MPQTFSKIELLDTESQPKTLADYFKEKELTLILFYRGDW